MARRRRAAIAPPNCRREASDRLEAAERARGRRYANSVIDRCPRGVCSASSFRSRAAASASASAFAAAAFASAWAAAAASSFALALARATVSFSSAATVAV
jgi:hypothetical protein